MLTQSTIDTIREELDERLDRDRVTISNWDEQKRYVPLNKFQEKHYIATQARVEAIEAALSELAELQADAGGVAGGLPMPDGPGFWAWEEGDNKGVSEIYEGSNELIVDEEPGGLNPDYYAGRTWYRLTMPWDKHEQPAPVVAVPAPDWLRAFPPEWDRHPWANYAYLQPSYSHFDGITFMWYYYECEPEWGEKSYNWVDGKHGYQNPVTRAPLSAFFDVRQTLQARPAQEGVGE